MTPSCRLRHLSIVVAAVACGSLTLLLQSATPSAAVDRINSPDTTGAVGYWTSLALDSQGNPVVSYQDRGFGTLRVLHCSDPECAPGGDAINTPDSGPAVVGETTSLALDALGNPVVAYHDSTNDDLKILHCNDPNCAPGGDSVTSPDTAGGVGSFGSLALDANGFPVVAYRDFTDHSLNVLHCYDASCAAGGDSITSPDTIGDPGEYASLVLDSTGNPVVSYYEHSLGDLRILHCDDPNCALGGDSVTTPDSEFFTGTWTSLALDGVGNPVVSYRQDTLGDLRILHCNDPNCAPGGDSVTSPDTAGSVGQFTSMALDAADNPVVSYQDDTVDADPYDLKILHCDDPDCAPGGDSITAPDPSTLEGWYTSLALDATGNAVVSYQGGDSDLEILHCDDPNCDPSIGPTATPTTAPTGTSTPSPTATASPTPAGHDSRLTRIGGVPKNVRLLPGEVLNDSGSVVVASQSTHSDTIGVYVDVMAPASGGCTPNGRVLQTTVTLAAGAKTTIPVPVSYSCADPAAANALSYTWVAVADHGADDLASCGPGALQSLACYNALADDDQDPSDNRVSRNGPRVVAQ